MAVASDADAVLVRDAVRGWHVSVRDDREREYREVEAFDRSAIEAAGTSLQRKGGEQPVT